MSTGPRSARVRAHAKLNLDLRIPHKRPDGYHELRTIYHTISLADTIDLAFTPSRRTTVEVESRPEIPDNLVKRAARLVVNALRVRGRVTIRLIKRIPMGAGLGGGSSDAAAILLALPVLAGKLAPAGLLLGLAAELGSDVPFFLVGGAAVGLGRGTEVYPLPELPPARGIVVAPDVHVSTVEAYGSLGRKLTSETPAHIINSFQTCENDFEQVVFEQYPQLDSIKRKLLKLGANPAMMTGSGSALFGLFRSSACLARARSSFREEKVFSITLLSRGAYHARWWSDLAAHIDEKIWPPQSRHTRRGSTA